METPKAGSSTSPDDNVRGCRRTLRTFDTVRFNNHPPPLPRSPVILAPAIYPIHTRTHTFYRYRLLLAMSGKKEEKMDLEHDLVVVDEFDALLVDTQCCAARSIQRRDRPR